MHRRKEAQIFGAHSNRNETICWHCKFSRNFERMVCSVVTKLSFCIFILAHCILFSSETFLITTKKLFNERCALGSLSSGNNSIPCTLHTLWKKDKRDEMQRKCTRCRVSWCSSFQELIRNWVDGIFVFFFFSFLLFAHGYPQLSPCYTQSLCFLVGFN